ncbi:MAG: YqcC family protein [Bryobacteraceae bacterium]|nr:YqcC family protein [Bryobacteraceae bacterium]
MNYALQKAAEIEAELKRIGLWSSDPIPEDAYTYRGAFAMDTMSFEQWLQFVLLPSLREIAAENGRFPKATGFGQRAIIEFDGLDNGDRLIELLGELEAWVEAQP